MPSLDFTGLVEDATLLKKAFVFGAAMLGTPNGLDGRLLQIPDYRGASKGELRRLIPDLRHDVCNQGRAIFRDWDRIQISRSVRWMAEKHRLWVANGQGIWDLGRVGEIEDIMGPLKWRDFMECPPYAQIKIQGFFGAAVRHPEYHLARDLALHMNLLLDATALDSIKQRQSLRRCSEVDQSLARSVILVCYNLLESFTSGLIAASRSERPQLTEDVRRKLEEPDRKRQSLKCRFADVPCLITGRPEAMLPYQKDVLEPLFSEHKWRRDAFVHCEPGPAPSSRGSVKEELFHEADLSVVRETVALAIKAIQSSWQEVYDRPGPRWLQLPDASGRFPKINVRLTDLEITDPRGK